MRYCALCGAKKVKEFTGTFSEKTGKREFMFVCSKDVCHTHHSYTMNSPKIGFFRSMFTGVCGVCEKCGHEDILGDY